MLLLLRFFFFLPLHRQISEAEVMVMSPSNNRNDLVKVKKVHDLHHSTERPLDHTVFQAEDFVWRQL